MLMQNLRNEMQDNLDYIAANEYHQFNPRVTNPYT